MRQVFTSQRLENVEQVARMLEEAGIEVRVTDGRSYRGNRRGSFSYRDHSAPRPAVWVVQSGQQAPARELLRESGLIDTTRANAPSYHFRSRREEAARPAERRSLLFRAGLLVAVVAIGGLALFRIATHTPPEPQLAAGPFDGSVGATLPGAARAVLGPALDEVSTPVACLAVDGADAPANVIDPLRRDGVLLVPSSHCAEVADEDRGSFHRASGQPATLVHVSAFRAASEQQATIELEAYHHRGWATYKTLQVERIEEQWQVTDTLRHLESRGLIGF